MSVEEATDPGSLLALASAAELFAEFLLIELSAERLEQLQDPSIEATLREVGVTLPSSDELEDVAADFFDRFVHPRSGFPLVESLYRDGTFEGTAAVAIREIAQAAGLDFNSDDARGAAVDHLGSELILWARLARRDADAAAEFADRHLRWAVPILGRSVGSGGVEAPPFLRDVTRATIDLLETILESSS